MLHLPIGSTVIYEWDGAIGTVVGYYPDADCYQVRFDCYGKTLACTYQMVKQLLTCISNSAH